MSTNNDNNSEAAIYAERLRTHGRLMMRAVRERESEEHRTCRLQLLWEKRKNERIINATMSSKKALTPLQIPVLRHSIGRMEKVCANCKALMWVDERKCDSSRTNPKFTVCCSNGRVQLPPPEPLYSLLFGSNACSCQFREKIRAYNSALAFTSIGAHIDEQTAVAAIVIDADDENVAPTRDIILRLQEGGLKHQAENRDDIYEDQLPITEAKKVTQLEYYSYRLQVHEGESRHLHQSGCLFQQYVVDAYVSIEHNCLNWYRQNQNRIRSELYQGLQDAIFRSDTVTENVGRRVVLPSSFTGGPRQMHQLYQDAMAIVRSFVKKATTGSYQRWCFWESGCTYIYVVEFQKRGLPHAHILIILASMDKPCTVDDIDKMVSAEIPDQEIYPLAYETVTTMMIHSPCGALNPKAPCMKDGTCSKRYPREFNTTTIMDDNAYPTYRRRNYVSILTGF
nr:4048_t:CDS:2 [Entrophospora candida]